VPPSAAPSPAADGKRIVGNLPAGEAFGHGDLEQAVTEHEERMRSSPSMSALDELRRRLAGGN
jgi:hypothetical protein